ncbi:hypothetical protein [Nocardia sp. NPDC058497]|uniref:hypothetical protein n=1 Tax=Nocardia sp. NPDC058497 TaxID=3346529 RepID=UPI00365A3C8D
MTGDPLEEGGQQMRQGFIQALQTAQMTAGLMRNRSGESRSQAESDQRIAHADAKEQRSKLEHQVRVLDTVAAADERATLNAAKVREVEARITNAENIAKAEVDHKAHQNQRAENDFQRRERAGQQEAQQSKDLHRARIDSYTHREDREAKLHDLDVELKQLRIEILRRNAGFTETLAEECGPNMARTTASAVAFAAADATATSANAEDAEAFRERFVADTGDQPPAPPDPADRVVIDALADQLQTMTRIVEDLTRESVVRGEILELGADSIVDVAEELSPSAAPGTVIDSAVQATGAADSDPAVADPAVEDMSPVAAEGLPRDRGRGAEAGL